PAGGRDIRCADRGGPAARLGPGRPGGRRDIEGPLRRQTMRARIVLAGAVLTILAAGAPAAPVPKAEPGKLDPATQAKVRKLRVGRRDALKEALAARQKEFLAGLASVATCLDVSASLLSAELDLATKAEERLMAHAAHLKIARDVEAAAKQWYN